MLRVDFYHHSQTSLLIPQQRVVQTPSGPGPCLPFQYSPCLALPHLNILEALNYPSVPYAFDHAELSIENVLPLLSAQKCLNEVRYLLLQEDLPDYCQSGWELLHLLPDPVSASITALTTTGIPLAFLTSFSMGKMKLQAKLPPAEAEGTLCPSPLTSPSVSLSSSPWEGEDQSDWSNLGPQFMSRQALELKGSRWSLYDLCPCVTGNGASWSFSPWFQLLNQGPGRSRFLDLRGRKLDITGLASAFWYQLHHTGMVFPILNILPQSETWREGRMMKSWTSDLHTDLESFVHDALYWLCRSENLLAWFPETSERMTPVLVPSPEFKNPLELSSTHLESLTFKWWLKS